MAPDDDLKWIETHRENEKYDMKNIIFYLLGHKTILHGMCKLTLITLCSAFVLFWIVFLPFHPIMQTHILGLRLRSEISNSSKRFLVCNILMSSIFLSPNWHVYVHAVGSVTIFRAELSSSILELGVQSSFSVCFFTSFNEAFISGESKNQAGHSEFFYS